MESISILMKDGTRRDFKHRPRPGGSYTLKLDYKGAFAVVTDEYYNQTAIPASDIQDIVTRAGY